MTISNDLKKPNSNLSKSFVYIGTSRFKFQVKPEIINTLIYGQLAHFFCYLSTVARVLRGGKPRLFPPTDRRRDVLQQPWAVSQLSGEGGVSMTEAQILQGYV